MVRTLSATLTSTSFSSRPGSSNVSSNSLSVSVASIFGVNSAVPAPKVGHPREKSANTRSTSRCKVVNGSYVRAHGLDRPRPIGMSDLRFMDPSILKLPQTAAHLMKPQLAGGSIDAGQCGTNLSMVETNQCDISTGVVIDVSMARVVPPSTNSR